MVLALIGVPLLELWRLLNLKWPGSISVPI